MQEKIKNLINQALKNLSIGDLDFVVEHPEDLEKGDYSTNAAMLGGKKNKINPKDLALKIAKELSELNLERKEKIEKIEVAGNGFINFYLTNEFFRGSIEEIVNNKKFAKINETRGERDEEENDDDKDRSDLFSRKNIMIEYTDPNPFKPFHIGHLMTNAIGESIARILEYSGAAVSRANYQGDVGLHVARAVYALLKNPEIYINKELSTGEQASLIGKAYAKGSEDYGGDEKAKKEIDSINKKIYDRSDKKINDLYEWGFRLTMEAFEDLYSMLGTKFDFYFLESQMAPIGEKIVRENIGSVFEKSDGAIVFKAENYDPNLHTRVFITSAGLPTYETKELGLTDEKFETLPDMNLSIVVTANEQKDYMRVVTKALSLVRPEFADKMLHITHGMMRFTSGKMSSRKGNTITGETLLSDTKKLVEEKMSAKEKSLPESEEIDKYKIVDDVAVAALKYAILKQSIGRDILYDFEKSISFEGDSGPYLQYSFARASSVLEKAASENISPDFEIFTPKIIELEKLLYRFPEIALRSATEYEPHFITNYLTEIARAYNSFYGNTVIVKKEDPASSYKVAITYAFTFVMKTGLYLLGIEAPVKM